MTGKIETIHVYLPEEAVDCWVPARAEHVRDDIYRLIDDSPEDPVLEFGKGDLVHCRMQKLDAGVRQYFDGLVAFKKAD
jgi:hypothetical protein